MSKNKKLINSMKTIAERNRKEYMESHVGNLQAMIDLCEKETGIKVIFQETS